MSSLIFSKIYFKVSSAVVMLSTLRVKIFFFREIRFVISCKSSTRQKFHIKHQALCSQYF